MKNRILKILSVVALVSTVGTGVVSCTNQNQNTQQTQDVDQSRTSRKPQVSSGNSSDISTEKVYSQGEIVTLADGSKLKYDESGNHEIVEQGSGKIIIFKKVTQEELDSLDASQKSMVERQMKSDPNGFSLIY